MTDFVLTIAIIPLLGATLWLWRLFRGGSAELPFKTSAPRAEAVPQPPERGTTPAVFGILIVAVVVLVIVLLFRVGGNNWSAVNWPALLPLPFLFVIGSLTTHLDRSGVLYAGNIRVPERVYVNDSHGVSVDLKPYRDALPGPEGWVVVRVTQGGKWVALRLPQAPGDQEFLEAELQAAGLTVAGDSKQRQALNLPNLAYHWNCYFGNSGRHTLSLLFRLVSRSGTTDFGSLDFQVLAAQLDGLTKRQVGIIARTLALVSGILAGAELLHRLGAW